MKQIKTIMVKVEQLETFDEKVNAALAEGWTLVKREVLQAYDTATCVFNRMLYAELERKEQEETEEDCLLCKHFDKADGEEPCSVCCHGVPSYSSKWEPEA